jgi:outer membrane protein assembly factor BamA
MKIALSKFLLLGTFGLVMSTMGATCFSQTESVPPSHPDLLPYSFSNFVWWSDDELQSLLKSRIAGLGSELAPGSATEHRIRDVLAALLKEKGIPAEVQSIEPSSFALTATRAPGSPPPSIDFSILSPQILIDKILVTQAPDAVLPPLMESLHQKEGHQYHGGQLWMVRSRVADELDAKGYLDSQVSISHDAPRRIDDHYAVNLLIEIKSGVQYRIASVTADGGPLLQGKDLSSHFTKKSGDTAGGAPFGRLPGEIRALYWHYGYADVEIDGPPALDRSRGEVSYHLKVVPGPLYHLRSVSIHELNSAEESRVRDLLGMKPGDVFDEMAINDLSHKIASDPLLAAYGFTFSTAKDRPASQVDLALSFYKTSDKSSVTAR